MRLIMTFMLSSIITASLFSQNLAKQMDSLSYSVGLLVAKNLKDQGIEGLKIEFFMKGVEDALSGNEPAIGVTEAQTIFQTYAQNLQERKAAAAKNEGQLFLEENAKKAGVTVLPNGLQYEILQSGPEGGKSPSLTDKVLAHYEGKLIDGTIFDSSVSRGEPATFPVNGVIKGWQEILQLMTPGDKWRVYIPENLAYGSRGAGAQIPPYSALIFEIELLEVQ